ncbi:MAG: rRNA pseudouridine synthase [Bacteriovoracaceae bacterium]|nr:rRNA pseudouridine synthase [Bacteriovoracaceae bacterium]
MPRALKPQNIEIRLQKVIADCGICSRRKAEVLITEGRVAVNGLYVTELGTRVNPHTDIVTVDDKVIDLMAIEKVYVLLNKPRAYVTTTNDPEGRKTVMDLVWGVPTRMYPVGRLDYLSEGLLLLTNDGEMANKIMHPRYEVTKVYEVKVFGHVNEALLDKIRKGVMTEDGLMKPQSVRMIEQLPNKTWLEFRLSEGKNREIRKICEAMDLTVDKLRRVAIEGLTIQGLPIGQFTFLSKKDLLKALGMNENGERVTHTRPKFVSAKKTVDVRRATKMVGKTARSADDRRYQGFRKDKYYETVKSIKEVAAQKALTESEPQG